VLNRALPSTWRTLMIAVAGLLLPLLWPGVLRHLFDTGLTMMDQPRALTVLHVGADTLIGVAYTFISAVLAYIVFQHRRLIPFDWVVLAFGLFIVACGLTHFMHVLVLLTPVYWLDAYLRGVTAVVSVATAVALPTLIPRVSNLLNVERALIEKQEQLEQTNVALQEAVARAEVLAALSAVLQTAQTTEEVEHATLGSLAPVLGACAMLVVGLQDGRPAISARWGNLPAEVRRVIERGTYTGEETPLLVAALRDGTSTYRSAEERPVDPDARTVLPMDVGVEPIQGEARTPVGAVVVWREHRHGPFTPNERELMGRAAATVGLALDRTRISGQIERQHAELDARSRALTLANEELEAFSYSVSHDLRAPLRHVIGFSNLAQAALRQTPNDRAETHLERVVSAGERMNTLIDAMLILARTSQQPLSVKTVDLAPLIAQAQRDAELEFAGHPVAWKIGPLCPLRADPVLLQQVVTNLVSNAVKYSSGLPESEVEIWVEPGRDEHLVLSVRDNGVGFDPEHAGRLFGLFQRLHSGREFQGTGVGLATVRRIAQRHHGQVSAESRPGQGATFRFSLPQSP